MQEERLKLDQKIPKSSSGKSYRKMPGEIPGSEAAKSASPVVRPGIEDRLRALPRVGWSWSWTISMGMGIHQLTVLHLYRSSDIPNYEQRISMRALLFSSYFKISRSPIALPLHDPTIPPLSRFG